MLASLRARVLNQRGIVSSNPHLGLLHCRALLLNSTRSFAVKPSPGARREEKPKVSTPVMSFLLNSCGLCTKSARSVRRRVNFQSLDNPNLFINVLKSYGFTQTQISRIVSQYPTLLTFNAQKVLLPKLEFFRSRGLPVPELTDCLSRNPTVLRYALDKTIIPCYDALKNAACLDDKQMILSLKKWPCLNISNRDSNVAPNIALLRGLEVPQSSITCLATFYPGAVFRDREDFVMAVEKVKKLGYDPSKRAFVVAIAELIKVRMSNCEPVFGYHEWRWYGSSTEYVFKDLTEPPIYMGSGENKIERTMDFLVNKMKLSSKDIAKYPQFLFYDLEDRIKPRYYVVQVLTSKGVFEEDLSLIDIALRVPEETFLQSFYRRIS